MAPAVGPRIRVFADLDALSEAAAARFVESCGKAIGRAGRFAVALSGGETPRRTYGLLAAPPFAARVEWRSVHVFLCDERCVPADSSARNDAMIRDVLLARVPIPATNLHRFRAEAGERAEAVREYDAHLERFFALAQDAFPPFDLALLGMGADGHTASLFPGSAALGETTARVAAHAEPPPGLSRLTLTLPSLSAARESLFLVAGPGKAATLARVVGEMRLPSPADGDLDARLPAARVRCAAGFPEFFVDRDAASVLPSSDTEAT